MLPPCQCWRSSRWRWRSFSGSHGYPDGSGYRLLLACCSVAWWLDLMSSGFFPCTQSSPTSAPTWESCCSCFSPGWRSILLNLDGHAAGRSYSASSPTSIPLALGTAVGLRFGYSPVASIVLGSLLASHTLLALPIIAGLGETRLEPVTVTVGATVMSDTLSLIVYAICAGIFHSGFSVLNLGVQLVEIAVFVPLVLFGLSRLGALPPEEN